VYGPFQFRVAVVVRPDGTGFLATCHEIGDVRGVGQTESEAVEQARQAAARHLQAVFARGGPIPDSALHRSGPNASLTGAIEQLLEAAHPGEGRKVRIEEIWLDALE
jgi:predicted RNase H-like HicB family nuclease